MSVLYHTNSWKLTSNVFVGSRGIVCRFVAVIFLFLWVSFFLIAKVENLISNIILLYFKSVLIYFIHVCIHTQTHTFARARRHTSANTLFSIKLKAILKWIIFEFIQQPSSYLCDFESGYCRTDCYQSRIIFPTEDWALKGYILPVHL